jgi:hypothetical protein
MRRQMKMAIKMVKEKRSTMIPWKTAQPVINVEDEVNDGRDDDIAVM